MSLSNSRLSYSDCFKLLDQALEESRGIRVQVPNIESANYLRMRIHHARSIDRSDNKHTYEDPQHPLHGRSVYDELIVRIEESGDRGWVYLDKQKVEIGIVEPIPADHQVEFASPKAIEGPKAIDGEFTEQEPQRLIPHIRRR